MGTEVLRAQDLLVERFRVPPASFQRRRNFPGNGNLTNLTVNRKQNNNTGGYKKTSPKQPDKKKFKAATDTKKPTHGAVPDPRPKDENTSGGLVMGQVTLLRRGESLGMLAPKIVGGNSDAPILKPIDDLEVGGTVRIGPSSPEMMPKQIRLVTATPADVYAGSAFFLSPSPRSVPLPSFFNKKDPNDGKPFDDGATRDLRRLLRLD